MDVKLTEIQEMVRESTRDMVRKQIAPAAMEADHSGVPIAGVLDSLAELGYLGACVPSDYDGAELDPLSLILAIREVAGGCASTANMMVLSNCLVCEALLLGGSDQQKKQFLPTISCGEWKVAAALFEPEEAASPVTFERKGDRFLLSGGKSPAAGLSHVDTILVSALENGSGVPSFFLIKKGDPGVEIGPSVPLLGLRAFAAAPLTLNSCEVLPERRIGGGEETGSLWKNLLAFYNTGIAAIALGIAEASLDAALSYSQERKQFGRPLCDFGAIREKLAESSSEIAAAKSMVLWTASEKEGGCLTGLQAARTRLFCTQMANRVVQRCLQVHGGYGYTKEYLIERCFRDARMLEIVGGTSEAERHAIVDDLIAESSGGKGEGR